MRDRERCDESPGPIDIVGGNDHQEVGQREKPHGASEGNGAVKPSRAFDRSPYGDTGSLELVDDHVQLMPILRSVDHHATWSVTFAHVVPPFA
jgi:hypothetical protein